MSQNFDAWKVPVGVPGSPQMLGENLSFENALDLLKIEYDLLVTQYGIETLLAPGCTRMRGNGLIYDVAHVALFSEVTGTPCPSFS